MQGTKRTLAALLMAGLALAVSATAYADEPVGIKAAHRVIKSEAKVILGFAYPTAKRLTSTDYDEGSKAADGSYQLIYTLNYVDSDGDDAYATLKFNFDKGGKLASIGKGAHSQFLPPFFAAKLFLELSKAAIKNDPKLANDRNWKELLKVNDPEEFLAGYMNLKNGK